MEGNVKFTGRSLDMWERTPGTQRRSGRFGGQKNLLPLLGFELSIVPKLP